MAKHKMPDPAKADAAMTFAMSVFRQVPTDDAEAFECHVTGVLVLFMGAMWGTLGDDYAREFIEAQLRAMEPGVATERYTPPNTH